MSEIKKQIKDFGTLTILTGSELILGQGTNGSTSNIEVDTVYEYFNLKDSTSGYVEETILTGLVSGSGIQTSSSGITSIVTDILDNTLTLSKLNQISDSKILGNGTNGLGNVSEIGIGNGLRFNGNDLEIDLGTALNITNADLPDSAVIAGDYNSVTVDQKGIVQSGTNFNYLMSTDISATSPIVFTTNDISITESSLTTDGYLSGSNFGVFNSKLSNIDVTLSGIVTGTNNSSTGAVNITTSIADNSLSFNYLSQITDKSLLGNYESTSGNIAVITLDNSLLLNNSGVLGIVYPSETSWTPIFTGFSVDPTGIFSYTITDKVCTVRTSIITNGTSNADTFTMTLPFIVKDDLSTTYCVGYGIDNAVEGLAFIKLVADSNIATIGFNTPSGLWSTSGDKNVSFTTSYIIK